MGRPRGVENAAPCNALLPFLLRFQLLLLGDILLQLAFAPAVDLGLFGALDAQRTGGHIMAMVEPAAVNAWSPMVTGATRFVLQPMNA